MRKREFKVRIMTPIDDYMAAKIHVAIKSILDIAILPEYTDVKELEMKKEKQT